MGLLLYILLELFLTALSYLFIPIIVILCYKNKKLSNKKIKRIAIINGIFVWLCIMVIRINGGEESTNFSVFLWAYFSYLLMKHFCLGEEIRPSKETKPKEKNRNSNKMFDTLLAIVMIISLALNVYLFIVYTNANEELVNYVKANAELESNNEDLEADVRKWKNDYQDIKQKWAEVKLENEMIEAKSNFLDEHIVMIEDNKTRYYHKYACEDFLGESFWAYNLENAKAQGYKPCPKCCK